jgi:hypothetical protein
MKQEADGFAKMVADAGGKAARESRAMHGLQDEGWFIDLKNGKITDELIDAAVEAAAKDPVFQLELGGSNITDEQLGKLDKGKVLQKVFVLDLSNTGITDAGLDGLSNHYVIRDLKLKGSKATSAAAKRLGDRQMKSPETPAPFKKQPKVEI